MGMRDEVCDSDLDDWELDIDESEWEVRPNAVDLPKAEFKKRLEVLGVQAIPKRMPLRGGGYAEGYEWKTPNGIDPDEFYRRLTSPRFWQEQEEAGRAGQAGRAVG